MKRQLAPLLLSLSIMLLTSCDSLYRASFGIKPETIQAPIVKIENEKDISKVKIAIEKYLKESEIQFTFSEGTGELKENLFEYDCKNISIGIYVKKEQSDLIIEYVQVNGGFPNVLYEILKEEFPGRIKIIKSGIGIFYF